MLSTALGALFAFAPVADARADGMVGASNAPVDFSADNLLHDDARQLIIASGNVEFVQAGRMLKADEVSYDLAKDVVLASGNVALMEANGDVHLSDELQLSQDMRDGFVRNLRTTLADGSRFTADKGERKDGTVTVMKNATYTPCEPCKLNPEKASIWQLSAGSVTHDTTKKTIAYRDATFDVYGVPVMYAPYFSHADGTVKQKTGFLTPTFKMDSQNGTSVGGRYYKAFGPDRDATVGLEAYTKQAPRLTTEYRQRLSTAEILFDGSVTYSGRTDRSGGITRNLDDELRGHLEGKAQWDMTDKWRSGFKFNVASDEQYFRQYDVSPKDVLENEIYAERFDGRDYAAVRSLMFQDLRISDRAIDQPEILPEAEASFYSHPGSVLGGRWNVMTSLLDLQRQGSDPDTVRASVDGNWQRRDILPFGLVTTADLSMRGDAYYSMDRPTDDSNARRARLFPSAQLTAAMPFVKPADTVRVLFEPLAAVTLAPNLDVDNKIPNEDSQDVQLDTSNLFEKNRFPGLDRVEDLSHVTYGLRGGLDWVSGSSAEAFLGQSYRLDDSENPFAENSGLSTQQSDIVGRLKVAYRDNVTLDYGFQLAHDDLNSIRHEFENTLNFKPFSLSTRYLFAEAIAGIGVTGRREQIQTYATYDINDTWRLNGGANYDLGENDGLRKALAGIDYTGQCVTLSAVAQRNLTLDATGESSTELMLRLGLKNLGEFQTSGISLARSSNESEDDSLKGIPVNGGN